MMHKIIGVYGEFCGPESEDLGELIKEYNIVGSLSGDAGDIEAYYTANGNHILVAHDSEAYYGKGNVDYENIDNKVNKPLLSYDDINNNLDSAVKEIYDHLEDLKTLKSINGVDLETKNLIKRTIIKYLYKKEKK